MSDEEQWQTAHDKHKQARSQGTRYSGRSDCRSRDHRVHHRDHRDDGRGENRSSHRSHDRHQRSGKYGRSERDNWRNDPRPLQPRVKVALYFGTFNPIHENHMRIALHAIDKKDVKVVFFVPNPVSLHKPFLTSLENRKALIHARCKIENDGRGGNFLRIYPTDAETDTRWKGRSEICRNVRRLVGPEFRDHFIEVFQLMGQDSFERPSAQAALAYPHVRNRLNSKLWIFPRIGEEGLPTPDNLKDKVAYIDDYLESDRISSTAIRQSIRDNPDIQPQGLHESVFNQIQALEMYLPMSPAPKHHVIAMCGGPGCGKGTLSQVLASEFNMVIISPGDYYRAGKALQHPDFIKLDNLRQTGGTTGPWFTFSWWFTGECMKRALELSEGHTVILERVAVNNLGNTESEMLHGHIDLVLYLSASFETMLARMNGRNREGDTPESNQERLDKYKIHQKGHADQLKTYDKENRGRILEINTETPVQEYIEQYNLRQEIEAILQREITIPKPSNIPNLDPVEIASWVIDVKPDFPEKLVRFLCHS